MVQRNARELQFKDCTSRIDSGRAVRTEVYVLGLTRVSFLIQYGRVSSKKQCKLEQTKQIETQNRPKKARENIQNSCLKHTYLSIDIHKGSTPPVRASFECDTVLRFKLETLRRADLSRSIQTAFTLRELRFGEAKKRNSPHIFFVCLVFLVVLFVFSLLRCFLCTFFYLEVQDIMIKPIGKV